MNDIDLLRREVEALTEASLHLTSRQWHLFSRTQLEFLEEIKRRSEKITQIANEKIMASYGDDIINRR